MPGRKVLAERIAGNERLREQQERWERDRRREDRDDRAKKDEELNGVRLQLRDQAASFATKEMVTNLERSFDQKLDTAIERLNSAGTEGYRESEAERHGRESATREILSSVNATKEATAVNRRWLIGIVVTVIFGVLANVFTLITLMAHIWKIF